MSQTKQGSCLCGSVAFEVELEGNQFDICHCGTCRQWGAGPFMGVNSTEPPRFKSENGLTWYKSSEWAERGFCAKCGSSLFYRLTGSPKQMLSIAVDTLIDVDDLDLGYHIYVDRQPKRYVFGDDRPKYTEAQFLEKMGVNPPAD